MKKLFNDFINEFKLQFSNFKRDGIRKQIPNLLTLSRAFAPLVIIITVLFNKMYLVILELIIFAITDFLDGKLARKFDCVSLFGKKLDAICDKIFAIGLIIMAVFRFNLLIFNLILEIMISYVNLLSLLKGNIPTSSMIGKVKTGILSLTLILIYIPNNGYYILFTFCVITLFLQILTFINYLFVYIKTNKSN